ncbi:hypothetical protein C2G38_2033612 [Gigaspora rosea]|uniref:Uncharacterized protein n=1 Tax=Gigaspora rosea TaxID=44941 RepID=A0A397VIV5_9GLOM|nr:hypothetical protein C2G38_2033612 [Gigaspora rosea]
MFFVNFNDYFIENFHSQIRANTSAHNIAENVIQQACVLGKKKKRSLKYKLAVLNKNVDITCLPMGYSTEKRLKKEDNTLTDNDGLEEEYQDLEDIDKPEDIQENEVVIDLQSALDNVDRCWDRSPIKLNFYHTESRVAEFIWLASQPKYSYEKRKNISKPSEAPNID